MVADALVGPAAPSWVRSFVRLRQEMDAWIEETIELHRHVPFLGHHDEGSFVASWLCHYQLTKDPAILEFVRSLRDGFAEWAATSLHHGFFGRGEVHHQTEIFNNFLARLWHVAPDDRTAELLLDAAEHIGNWVPGVPPWFDWDNNRFMGWHIGTSEMPPEPGFEVPDHFRLIQLALTAHDVSKDSRYLELSTRWASRWAAAILAEEQGPPVALFADGHVERAMRAAVTVGLPPSDAGSSGIEPYVAAGAIDVLLDLYKLVGEPLYANAARALCVHLVDDVGDPYANPPGALFFRYRAEVGDTSMDAQLMGSLAGATFEPPGTPVLVLHEPTAMASPGVGKRADMVRWAYRDERGTLIPETGPSPSALMLAYQITGGLEYAARAMELAAIRLHLARTSLRTGRRHGCGGRSVSAVASGHGRDSGYGNVTGCFYALAHGATKFLGQERPALTLTEGDVGFPVEAAALTRHSPGLPVTAMVWHDGEVWTVQGP